MWLSRHLLLSSNPLLYSDYELLFPSCFVVKMEAVQSDPLSYCHFGHRWLLYVSCFFHCRQFFLFLLFFAINKTLAVEFCAILISAPGRMNFDMSCVWLKPPPRNLPLKCQLELKLVFTKTTKAKWKSIVWWDNFFSFLLNYFFSDCQGRDSVLGPGFRSACGKLWVKITFSLCDTLGMLCKLIMLWSR